MIATLTKTARALVSNRNRDTAAQLEKAIAVLRLLEQKRRQIIAFNDAVIAELTQFQKQEQSAAAAYGDAIKARDINAVRESVRRWMPLRPLTEYAQRELAVLNHARAYGSELAEFFRDPTVKE